LPSPSSSDVDDTLDISDFIFYSKTYHYSLESYLNETTTIYNAELDTNITIHFDHSIALILQHHDSYQTFDLLNDKHWQEISFVSSIQSEPVQPSHSESQSRKLLSQQEPDTDDSDSKPPGSMPDAQSADNHFSSDSDDSYYEKKHPKVKSKFTGVRKGREWADAAKYCRITRRGQLATIHDDEDNSIVTSKCEKMGFHWHCWLGLRRPFTRWIDGTPVDVVNWLPEQPNNFDGHEDCVEIQSEFAQWNDLMCRHGRSFVCQNMAPPKKPEECDCMQSRYGVRRRRRRRRRRTLLVQDEEEEEEQAQEKEHCSGCTMEGVSKKKRKTIMKKRRRWKRIRAYERWLRRKKDRRRSAIRRARKKERRRRARWRAHLRKVRHKKREEMENEIIRLKRMERRRQSAWNLLDKLLGSALHGVPGGVARFGQVGTLRRRRRARRRRRLGVDATVAKDGDDDQDKEDCKGIQHGLDMVARCRVVQNTNAKSTNYEVCVNYNFGDKFLSVDVRSVQYKQLRRVPNEISYRTHMAALMTTENDTGAEEDDDDDEKLSLDMDVGMDEDGEEVFDPVADNLGFAVWKYDMLQWHAFTHKHAEDEKHEIAGRTTAMKQEYGAFDTFTNYVHYFEEFEFFFNNNEFDDVHRDYVECSSKIRYFPFKMCMRQLMDEATSQIETILYFEHDVNDRYDSNATYSFEVKQFIDHRFESTVLHFNNDEHWDEITAIDSNMNMQWRKKCTHKLLIAKVCIEQFDENDSRASIKFPSKNRRLFVL